MNHSMDRVTSCKGYDGHGYYISFDLSISLLGVSGLLWTGIGDAPDGIQYQVHDKK